MGTKDQLFSRVALISFVVKTLSAYDKDKQIGKTLLQKIFYCLSRKNLADFSYSLYHYGPYSAELSKELNFAEDLKYVEVTWQDNKGYFIKLTPLSEEIVKVGLSKDRKSAIEKTIKQYKEFNAQELSIITTGYYMKDVYKTKDGELVDTIHEIKPQYETAYIKSVLNRDKQVS